MKRKWKNDNESEDEQMQIRKYFKKSNGNRNNQDSYYSRDGNRYQRQFGKQETYEEQMEVVTLRRQYGAIIAQLIGQNLKITQLELDLKDKDEAISAAITKLKELIEKLEEKRQNVMKFLKNAWYVGLKLMVKDRPLGVKKGETEDTYTIFYNGAGSDKVETKIVRSNEGLDSYCAGIVRLIEGKQIQEKVENDEDLNKIKELLQKRKKDEVPQQIPQAQSQT